jgi:hypothetical protein
VVESISSKYKSLELYPQYCQKPKKSKNDLFVRGNNKQITYVVCQVVTVVMRKWRTDTDNAFKKGYCEKRREMKWNSYK